VSTVVEMTGVHDAEDWRRRVLASTASMPGDPLQAGPVPFGVNREVSILPPTLAGTAWVAGHPIRLDKEISAFLEVQPAKPNPGDGGGSRGWVPPFRIVLAYSGTPRAEAIVGEMIRLSAMIVAEVRVLHVREFGWCRGLRIFRHTQEESMQLTHEAVARLRRCGVAATGVVCQAYRGDVAWAIVREAQQEKASVVLLGARRRNPITACVAVNVVRQVLRRATMPVLVVKTDQGAMPLGTRQKVMKKHRGTHAA
jgi:nucleotide-binding universal stress UspA family protein